MKIIYAFLVATGLATRLESAPFINLDFELAMTTFFPGRASPAAHSGQFCICDVMPGWSVFGSTNTHVNFNLDCPEVCGSIYSSDIVNSPVNQDGGLARRNYFPNGIRGNIAIGDAPFPGAPPRVLSQRGDVPDWATHITADVQVQGAAQLQIALDGKVVYMQGSVGVGIIINSDISSYAGKTVDLEIRFLGFAAPFANPRIGLDGIAFVTAPQIQPASAKFGTNGFTCTWTNNPIVHYQVESTTNIAGTWQAIGSTVTSTNGTFTFTDTNATAQATGQRFYRLRVAQ